MHKVVRATLGIGSGAVVLALALVAIIIVEVNRSIWDVWSLPILWIGLTGALGLAIGIYYWFD